MTRILIVEDNDEISAFIAELLSTDYEPVQAFSGTEAKRIIDTEPFDCILLDLMLPGMSGEELLRHIRTNHDVPVIVLTAKGDISVLVDVFEMGANDYVAKPFNSQELLARISAQLRKRGNYTSESILRVGELELNEAKHQVLINNKEIIITNKEFELLRIFMSQPGRVFTKANLYELVWHETYFGDDNTISVHISRLRAKIIEVLGRDVIETIWGVGFKLII